MIEAIIQANKHPDSVAILAGGKSFTYRQLLSASQDIGATLLLEKTDLSEARVAFMVSPGFDYVATLWGIWQSGGVAVPLCLVHPVNSLKYTLSDSGSEIVVASPEFESILKPLCEENKLRLVVVNTCGNSIKVIMPDVSTDRRAMILYTSGTTNLPKGVVTTHQNLKAQICALIKAWQWSPLDHTVCVLPLHHVHGIINVVCCSLWIGARCEFIPAFDPKIIFDILKAGKVNVFMAVPTIYYKLITHWEELPGEQKQNISIALTHFRLMVSGSAALPISVMANWKRISGHLLLERYGMTELGMAISNPYNGERKPGHVGIPLPGVSVRLCNEKDEVVHDEPGEIQVKGDNVFLEYWNKPEETKKSFTLDGWFKTGDVAVVENEYYRILGRNSVDIIKSGGYKISALEIEEVLRQHPSIKDCAVIGLENEEWGELVAAALVLAEHEKLDPVMLTGWLKEKMPAYRIPRKFLAVNELPRNAMGKVPKNEVKKLFSI